MTFADLAAGYSVFLDANVLIYHFGPHPTFGPACNRLIERVQNQELRMPAPRNGLSQGSWRPAFFLAWRASYSLMYFSGLSLNASWQPVQQT